MFIKTAKLKELSDVFSYPARIFPVTHATVLADSDGVITRIMAPLGTSVKKGQHLAKVEHTDPVYQYRSAIVRSPVNGVVSALDVQVGSQVTKRQQLLTVTDPTKVRIQVEIAAVDLGSIKKRCSWRISNCGQQRDY